MQFFKFSKRQTPSRKTRPAVSQSVISPLESRQMMSMVAPPVVQPNAGAMHTDAFAYTNLAPEISHAGPAFGQGDVQSIPDFAGNLNGFTMPVGLIGENLVGTHRPQAFESNSGFGDGFANAFRSDAASPAVVGASISSNAGPPVESTETIPTPGGGLLYLIHQAAMADVIASANPAPAARTMTSLNSITTTTTPVVGSALRTEASAIGANVTGLVSSLESNMVTAFDGALQQWPAQSTASAGDSTLTADLPTTVAETHPFADGATNVEQLAKSVGDAFLRSLVTDLAQFESGVESAVTELGHSLNWRAVAAASAVVALGASLQPNKEDEKKIASLNVPGSRRGE